MKTQAKDMTKGHPGRLLLQFALPLMLGNIFQQTYTMVDTAGCCLLGGGGGLGGPRPVGGG